MNIGTSRDSRRLDTSLIVDYGVSEAVLMENAAIAARDVIAARWGMEGRDILVACGTGNNGGDGLALARLLYARGAAVTLLLTGTPEKLGGAAADNHKIAERMPLEILFLEKSPDPKALNRIDFDRYDLIVDAIFGTGLSRDIEGRIALMVERINASPTAVLSLDIPSGVSADSGEVLGIAIQADATVCFGIPKRGNLLYPGFALGGQLYHSEISFPPEVTGDEDVILKVNVPPPLPKRNPAGHKGSFGKVLIIGGSPRYIGAPAMAAVAAMKSGAGYVRLAVPSSLISAIFPIVPEAVFLPLETDGPIGSEFAPDLREHAADSDSVVLGPGLSTSPQSVALARELIESIDVPLILDGDGITALAGHEELSLERKSATIITPHPGEMARLLGSSVREVETRRVEIALEAAERYGAFIVLKGAHSIIATPDGHCTMNLTGNSGMGSAGSGDVLAGIVGALAASGLDAETVLRLAVFLHGLSGDIAAETLGENGLTATGIIENIPEAFMRHRQNRSGAPFFGKIIPI